MQIPYIDQAQKWELRKEIKEINPQVVISVRIPLNSKAEENVFALVKMRAEVIHLLANEKGKNKIPLNQLFWWI